MSGLWFASLGFSEKRHGQPGGESMSRRVPIRSGASLHMHALLPATSARQR